MIKTSLHITLITLAMVSFFGCSPENEMPEHTGVDTGYNDSPELNKVSVDETASVAKSNVKTHNGISYSFNQIRTIDFLERKGETVSSADRKNMADEIVLIAEFKSNKTYQSIFEAEQMEMDKDLATQYLVGDMVNDLTIEQGEKSFSPLGVHYEENINQGGKLRVFVFFKGIDSKKATKVIFYDRLFGAGFLRFTLDNLN